MDVNHAPIGWCETWMRQLNNFAKDNPLYWPQPYHITVRHLAVIPYPGDSLNDPLRWAWYQPSPGDFESVNLSGLMGVVCLVPSLKPEFTTMTINSTTS